MLKCNFIESFGHVRLLGITSSRHNTINWRAVECASGMYRISMIVYLVINDHVCGGGVVHERADSAAGYYSHMCTLFCSIRSITMYESG